MKQNNKDLSINEVSGYILPKIINKLNLKYFFYEKKIKVSWFIFLWRNVLTY